MRFDMLDEYSTLVPFGLGVSKRNKAVQYSDATTEAVKPDAIADSVSRLKVLFGFLTVLGQVRGRQEYKKIY